MLNGSKIVTGRKRTGHTGQYSLGQGEHVSTGGGGEVEESVLP